MTDRSCPLCSENQVNYIFTERGHDLLQCQACDLFFIHPYPEQTEVYETVSDYEYDDLEILDSQRHYESSCATHDFLYPQMREEFVGAKNVLDVGCGTGRLLELLKEFEGVFSSRPGNTDRVVLMIDTGESPPIRQVPYSVPLGIRDQVKSELDELVECETIEINVSPWASPLVPVTKSDGGVRLCVNF